MTHPATLAWWDMRPVCRSCKHHIQEEFAERCGAYRIPPPGQGNRQHDYCIDARSINAAGKAGLCGPAAHLYEARDA